MVKKADEESHWRHNIIYYVSEIIDFDNSSHSFSKGQTDAKHVTVSTADIWSIHGQVKQIEIKEERTSTLKSQS